MKRLWIISVLSLTACLDPTQITLEVTGRVEGCDQLRRRNPRSAGGSEDIFVAKLLLP